MNRAIARSGIVALGILVAGCATPRAPEPVRADPGRPQEKVDASEPVGELENALKYFNMLRNVAGNDFRREQDAARQAFMQVPSELNRVRLALVLSLPTNAQKDERRALELLDPMAKSARAEYSALRGFALVVQAFVRDQIKLGNNAQALKDKLDALMSLEKSLAERERAAPGGGR